MSARRAPRPDPHLLRWREAWSRAVSSADAAALAGLGAELEALGFAEEDIEIEREMLAGLRDLGDLITSMRASGLPTRVTGHRVVGGDPCHFIAPASVLDEPSQPSGQLLLTARRAIFVGGGAARAVQWHHVRDVMQSDRDLVLLLHPPDPSRAFRCTSFSDALRSAFIARALVTSHRRPRAGL